MEKDKINEAKSLLFDSLKDEINNLSPIKRWLFEAVFDKILSIFSSDCKDSDVEYSISSLGKVDSEYIRESDLLNYDESMSILGFCHNRTGFKQLMVSNGIEQVVFKNRKVGYKRSDIMRMKSELDKKREKDNESKNYTVSKGRRHYHGLSMIEKLR